MSRLVALAEDTDRVLRSPPIDFLTSKKAIEFSLSDLQQVGDSANPSDEVYVKSLGFVSLTETSSAKAGPEVRVFVVPSTGLKNFLPQEDPNKLLINTHEIIIPILVNGAPRSSLTLGEPDEKRQWRILRKGLPDLIRLIERYRTSEVNSLVVIPRLGLKFLDDRQNGTLVLIPLQNSLSLNLEAGHPILAQEVFALISEMLKKMPGSVQP